MELQAYTFLTILLIPCLGNTLVSSDGTVFVKASTNAPCCLEKSILASEDGSNHRWPILNEKDGSFECSGGFKKTFQQWIDWLAGAVNKIKHKHVGICFQGWRYSIKKGIS